MVYVTELSGDTPLGPWRATQIYCGGYIMADILRHIHYGRYTMARQIYHSRYIMANVLREIYYNRYDGR